MKKNNAIPKEYMTVGELAKKMGTTVRTLQYYDKEGLLSPSSESNGGRRLYSYKDMIKLHQILSLKSLGFSLDDIKNRLISLDTPADVANALSEQINEIQEKIVSLSESLKEIEALKAEVMQMQSVDFRKYADIIVNLQMKNEFYWLIKHFDDKTLDYIRGRFDKESGLAFMDTFNQLCDKVIQLKENNIPPESEEAQNIAKAYWDMIMEFTGGDMNLLPNLMELGRFDGMDNEWVQKQKIVTTYIESALNIYFSKLEVNPFEGQ